MGRADAMMDMHHQSHSEEWRGEIDDWDRHKNGNQGAGEKHCAVVGLTQSFGLRYWLMAHCCQLEIFASEQIGAGQEKNDRAGASEKQEWDRRSEERRVGKEWR